MTNAKVPSVKPGEKVHESGIYKDPKSGKKTTLDKGETAPPTPEKGGKWKPWEITNPKK
jgi:hypothetical protein